MVELGKIEGTLFELEKAAVRIFYDISCAKKEYRLNGKINPIKEEVSQIADDAWALAAGLEEFAGRKYGRKNKRTSAGTCESDSGDA